MSTRTFVPAYIDQFQSSTYTLVRYTWDGAALVAHFADGHAQPSIYPTPDVLFVAGKSDWRERVREVL